MYMCAFEVTSTQKPHLFVPALLLWNKTKAIPHVQLFLMEAVMVRNQLAVIIAIT